MNRLRRFRFFTALAILVLSLGLLAACGGNENNTTELNGDEGFGDVEATLTVDEVPGWSRHP